VSDYDELDEEAPEVRERRQRAEKSAKRIVKEDLLSLAKQAGFRRWMGRLVQRCGLTDDLHTTNGGDIQRFMGRRSIAVEVLAEIEQLHPGFYEQILSARRAFEAELRTELKENDDG
jgi:hypothetical protein